MSVMERKNGEGEEEPVRMKESWVLEQSLEHVWDLFAWVCKSRMDNLVIFLYFSGEKSAEIVSCRMIPQLKCQLLSKVFLSGFSWAAACQQL